MYIASTDSTNNLMRASYSDREDLFTIRTDFQTAGRGQQGNGWESEQGKNLLFTTLLRGWNIPAAEPFVLNEVVSVALYRAVVPLLTGYHAERLSIKWPNDLYYADRKLAGILIENTLQGSQVNCSIVGIGLNVNQTIFLSSAPNPCSIAQITGTEHAIEPILNAFLCQLQDLHRWLCSGEYDAMCKTLHADYMNCLYRRKGFYLWQEREVSLAPSMPQMQHEAGQFMARIEAVSPNGELILCTETNEKRTYHFKQVRYVL